MVTIPTSRVNFLFVGKTTDKNITFLLTILLVNSEFFWSSSEDFIIDLRIEEENDIDVAVIEFQELVDINLNSTL